MFRAVVHEHYASNLHVDLSIEMDGVLKSFASPRELVKSKKSKIMQHTTLIFLLAIQLFMTSDASASVENGVFGNISSVSYVRRHIRALPVKQYAVLKAGEYFASEPFEGETIRKKNIYTYVKPQSPVVVTAEHTDLPFVFAENELVEGWIRKENLIPVNEAAFRRSALGPRVILKKRLAIEGIHYPVASRLPLVRETRADFVVLIAGETGKFSEYTIRKKEATKPLQLNSRTLAQTAKLFMRKPYAWGNSERGWDCSGLLVDYFSFFDIAMPRNSYQQISYFEHDYVAEVNGKKKAELLRGSVPYLTLLYFPGHIMLYTGKKGRDFQSFQAIGSLGRKRCQRVGYFPLVRTGLLDRVTRIGHINPEKGATLLSRWVEGKLGSKDN